MPPIKEELADRVRREFSDVTLGNGIGLFEAQGLDQYADEATLKKLRERDEKKNWAAIPFDLLNECNSSLTFFDAPGMKFHLPAFLICDLEGKATQDIVFILCYVTEPFVHVYDDLTATQRKIVCDYLRLYKNDPMVAEMVENAINSFWNAKG